MSGPLLLPVQTFAVCFLFGSVRPTKLAAGQFFTFSVSYRTASRRIAVFQFKHVRIVAEQFEVVRVQFFDSAQLVSTDFCYDLRRYVRSLLLPAVVRVRVWKADAVRYAERLEDRLRVLVQRLVVPDEVVVHVARVAQQVRLSPVIVRQQLVLRVCGPRIEQILNHLSEFDVVATFQRLFAGVCAAHCAHDLAAETLRIVVGRLRELVPVGRHEPLKRMSDERELEVSLQPLLYLQYVST